MCCSWVRDSKASSGSPGGGRAVRAPQARPHRTQRRSLCSPRPQGPCLGTGGGPSRPPPTPSLPSSKATAPAPPQPPCPEFPSCSAKGSSGNYRRATHRPSRGGQGPPRSPASGGPLSPHPQVSRLRRPLPLPLGSPASAGPLSPHPRVSRLRRPLPLTLGGDEVVVEVEGPQAAEARQLVVGELLELVVLGDGFTPLSPRPVARALIPSSPLP